jgi:hypothetical protein
MTADRTLGQAAYERYATLFGTLAAPKRPWEQLRPPDRARWEDIAVAVLGECGGSDG